MAASTDWLKAFHGPRGAQFSAQVKRLHAEHLRNYPRLWFAGRTPAAERLRECARYAGSEYVLLKEAVRSSSPLFFRNRADERLYRALVLNESFSADEWGSAIGLRETQEWLEEGLLDREDGGLVCRFRIVVTDRVFLVLDAKRPLAASSVGRAVHFEQDALHMLRYLARETIVPGVDYLDVGTGSGVILLHLAGFFRRSAGMDVLPRAAEIAALNRDLNGPAETVRVFQADVFDWDNGTERFDLVTWNMPFVFFDEEYGSFSPSTNGGRLGIEVTVRFLSRLPSLMSERGRAYLMTATPVLPEGRPLFEELKKAAARRGWDVEADFLHPFWIPRLGEFHRKERVRRFEAFMVRIVPGAGRFSVRKKPVFKMALDGVHAAIHSRNGGKNDHR
ncbi:MAG TPA: methyltransferase domain-containing protein [Candidatus Eisenbacteria bacterium]|nr:methyltransferase domain-containing protein [Candidatus Eisenbacteria bacterium]